LKERGEKSKRGEFKSGEWKKKRGRARCVSRYRCQTGARRAGGGGLDETHEPGGLSASHCMGNCVPVMGPTRREMAIRKLADEKKAVVGVCAWGVEEGEYELSLQKT